MPTFYVNKSGSDANNGSTPMLAKLTIQAAITAAANGDTVVVGSGSYNENLSIAATKGMFLNADGVVVLDGQGLLLGPAISYLLVTSRSLVIQPHTTGGRWIIRGYIGGAYIGGALISATAAPSVAASVTVTLRFVELYGWGNKSGLFLASTISSWRYANVYNCVFKDFTNYGVYAAGGEGGSTTYFSVVNSYNCTYYNCYISIYSAGGTGGSYLTALDNIFSNTRTAMQIGDVIDLSTSIINSRNQFYTFTNNIRNTTTYSSLATWQAAGYDLDSIEANPNFVDVTNNVFYLKTASAVGNFVGAYPFGLARGAGYGPVGEWDVGATPDNSMWYSADGHVGKNAITGFFELVGGTSGVVYSPVWNMTTVQAVSRIELAADQTWGVGMIDTTKTDVRPNYQTLEIRASGSSFDQDDAIVPWAEVKWGVLMSLVSGRYIQVRLTFRSDDVAA